MLSRRFVARLGNPADRASAQPSSTAPKATTSTSAESLCAGRGITPRIARRGVDSSERLGRYRWIVERTNAWVLAFRRLAVRFNRHAPSVLAFLHLACALICVGFLDHIVHG